MVDMRNILASTGYAFKHFAWKSAPEGDYGVWAEESGADLVAGNRHIERATAGTIDYFTRNDSIVVRETIESALNSAPILWALNAILFEEDTGFIHYEWTYTVYG